MKEINFSITVIALIVLAIFLATPNYVMADPFLDLETLEDWELAPIDPVPFVYPAADDFYGLEGDDFTFVEPQLYVYEGDGIPGSGTEDAGLVMTWGDPAPPDPALPQLSSWEFTWPEDPNIIGTTLSVTVMAPLGTWAVSLTLNDAAGGWVAWDWFVNTPGNPLGFGPINPGIPYTITIDPTVLGPQSGSSLFAVDLIDGFNPAIATTIQADALAVGPLGWTAFPSVPVIGGSQPWTYWTHLTVIVVGCGDGVLDAGEECDDNNLTAGDGCSATCRIESGWTCSGAPSVCSPALATPVGYSPQWIIVTFVSLMIAGCILLRKRTKRQ